MFPFKIETFDLVVNNFHLHFNNDQEAALARILDTLKPDGCFIGSAYGERTLEELKACFLLVEAERSGGIGQHTYPFLDVAAIGNRINRLGFNISSCVDTMAKERFSSAMHLMEYLSQLGLSSTGESDREGVLRDVILGVCGLYDYLYSASTSSLQHSTSVSASFDIIEYVGWKYAHTHQKPKERGSGMEFKDWIKEVSEEGETGFKYGVINEDGNVDEIVK